MHIIYAKYIKKSIFATTNRWSFRHLPLLPEAVHRLVDQQLATLRHRRAVLIDFGSVQVGDVHTGNTATRAVYKSIEGATEVSGTV
ncbi:MAG: hypothetical protein HGA19_17835 [Oscillochloris sp.]|nr:hypothetical protein [Oscillochloris sp.]